MVSVFSIVCASIFEISVAACTQISACRISPNLSSAYARAPTTISQSGVRVMLVHAFSNQPINTDQGIHPETRIILTITLFIEL